MTTPLARTMLEEDQDDDDCADPLDHVVDAELCVTEADFERIMAE